jgi:hypothetical protein
LFGAHSSISTDNDERTRERTVNLLHSLAPSRERQREDEESNEKSHGRTEESDRIEIYRGVAIESSFNDRGRAKMDSINEKHGGLLL